MVEIVILLLVLLIIGREYLSYKERKDLYNRLMARNLTEVQEVEKKIKPMDAPSPEVMPPDIIPMSDLSEDVFDEIIKNTLNREPETEKAIKKLKRKVK